MMKLKITTQNYNPLLKRKEVAFEVEHALKEGTPTRAEMRRSLAESLKANVDLIFIIQATTKRGSMLTVGEANVYDTQEQVKIVEAKHIVTRNVPPPPKTKEEAETPKAEPAPTSTATKPKEQAENKPKEA